MSIQNEIHSVQKLLKDTKLKDIMKTPVVKIYEDESVSRAVELFVEHSIYYLPVVNRMEQLVGVITHKYLFKTQSPRKGVPDDLRGYSKDLVVDGDTFYDKITLDTFKLKDIMNPKPFTLAPNDSVADAILVMTQKNIGCISIIKANREICGILTHIEIVDDLARLIMLD